MDWESLYLRHLPLVYNYFRYRVGDRQIAEDLTATVFERAWQHRHRFRSDLGEFSAWLLGIARNVAKNHFRHHHREISLDAIPETVAPDSPEEAVLQGEDHARLKILLGRLPPREQDLIALKYGAGLTNREIARLTGLSETNVGTILYRVVGRLRKEMEEDGR